MTEIKKPTADDRGNVTVKMSKLTEGIGIVFSGVLTMLEALDVDTAAEIADLLKNKKDDAVEDVQPAGKEETGNENVEDGFEGAIDDTADELAVDVHADEPVEEPVKETKPAKKTKKADTASDEGKASSLTKDDITKVIARKIKMDTSNNAKIFSVLKTYGVVKVSELPEEKYEAFLSDIAQL